jgi:hypothetical protein
MKQVIIQMSEEEYTLAFQLMAASIKNIISQAGEDIGKAGALFAIRNSFVLLASVVTRSLRVGGIDLDDAIAVLKDAIESIAEIEAKEIVTAIYEKKDFIDKYGSIQKSESIF